jgi:hypothetical protein
MPALGVIENLFEEADGDYHVLLAPRHREIGLFSLRTSND